MDIQRTIALSVFFISAFLLWDAWQKQHLPPQVQTPAVASTPKPSQPGTTPPPSSEAPIMLPGAAVVEAGALPTGKRLQVTTDNLAVEIDTAGGDLRSVTLTKHKGFEDGSKPFYQDALDRLASLIGHKSFEDQSKPLLLMRDKGEPYYVTQSGLQGEGLPTHNTTYAALATSYALTSEQDKLEVRLTAPETGGVKVDKIYTFHRGSYVVDLAYAITNDGKTAISPEAYFLLVRDSNPSPGDVKMLNTFTGAALYSEQNKFKKVSFSDIDKYEKSFKKKANDGWIGFVQHYFVTAWLPKGSVEREFYIDKPAGGKLYRAGFKIPVAKVEPGQTVTVDMPLYVGPQEVDKLAKLASGLDLVVDYGIFTIIAAPIFKVLHFIHGWVGNWGVAIILLTVLIKLVFFPLQSKASRSMAQMKVLAPKMQKLKEQYGDDRQKLQQATMELYKKEKINPLGGCLPIVIQIPVFISLYWVLLASVDLRHAPFALWINDLSANDPFYVLPVIYAVTMFVQMKLQPASPDPVQQKVMMAMPIIFSVMFLFFPAGLVLYWIVNNVLSISQQWYINRLIESENAVKGHAKR